jgi:hypothetical protein
LKCMYVHVFIFMFIFICVYACMFEYRFTHVYSGIYSWTCLRLLLDITNMHSTMMNMMSVTHLRHLQRRDWNEKKSDVASNSCVILNDIRVATGNAMLCWQHAHWHGLEKQKQKSIANRTKSMMHMLVGWRIYSTADPTIGAGMFTKWTSIWLKDMCRWIYDVSTRLQKSRQMQVTRAASLLFSCKHLFEEEPNDDCFWIVCGTSCMFCRVCSKMSWMVTSFEHEKKNKNLYVFSQSNRIESNWIELKWIELNWWWQWLLTACWIYDNNKHTTFSFVVFCFTELSCLFLAILICALNHQTSRDSHLMKSLRWPTKNYTKRDDLSC